MRKRISHIVLAMCLLLAGSGTAWAAGFNIYEAGARATALGCAFTATADDGSALFYNAAGLSFMTGHKVELNVMPIGPRFRFTEAERAAGDVATGEAADKLYISPGVYFTHNPGGRIAYGVGAYAPFGLGVEWLNANEWIGRQISYDVGIETIYITPAASFLITDELAFAVGLDVAFQHLKLQKMTLHPTEGVNALDTTIEGTSDLNVTPSLGLMYRPAPELSFGIMYHHKKTLKFRDQDATLNNMIPAGGVGADWPATLLAGLGGSDQKVGADFKIPYILAFGISYRFSERFRGEADLVHFGWEHFDQLNLDFATDALDQTIHFDYENTWQYRFGVEYVAMPEQLTLMAGYVRDKTPQPLKSVSPLLPDSDRNDYSIGAQYKHGQWEFTLSYMAVISEERTNISGGLPANPDEAYPVGTYKSLANIYGLGVGYNF